VPDASLPAFRRVLEQFAPGLAARGLILTCKGPWPCCSFAVPEP
jgi:hypothetical protein